MTRSLLALALAGPLVLGACVVINADSHSSYSGRYIGDETLSKVQPGASEDLVKALFGEPTTKTELAEGGAIWKWSYQRKVQRHSYVLLLVRDDSTKETEGAAYVQFGADGLVRHVWRD
jgi:outer membrane protein assembly factor BamE (lipoprotein component of BamABCDE complex)